jgi:hypothetical protein
MLNNHASGTSGDRRYAPFLYSNSQVTGGSLGRARMALSTFKLLGRCTASIACCIFAFILAVSSAASLSAQTAGQISGHVTDPTGALVPGVAITLTNVGTAGVRSTVTTGAGDYLFPDVPPGIYNVEAKRPGFKTESSNNVELQIQQSLRLDFKLVVGQETQSVIVEATGELLQAENATLGTVVENQAINELPLNGRNFLSLVALSSNANTLAPYSSQAGSRLGGDRSTQSISVGGQRIMFDYYTLDGVNNTDPDFNTYVGLPSLDGIQEFKVQTGVYPAEFGHEASQVNVVSKSGTNTYHGSMYDFIRNNLADATSYYFPYNATPPSVYPYKWNDYGFELDGPIRIPKVYNGRDKFFFMVDDEWKKVRSIGQSGTTVPSPAVAGGNFQGFSVYNSTTGNYDSVTIYDPATGDANGLGKTPFPNNTIPSSRIASQSTALLKYLGTSTTPYYNSSNQLQSNYKYSTTAPEDHQGLAVRGDYVQSEKLQYAFRYSSGKENLLSTGLLGAGSKTITNYYQYMGSNTWTITPRIVNEARFGYNHFFNSLGLVSAYTDDVVDSLGIPNLSGGDPSTWGIPSVTLESGPTGTTSSIWGDSNHAFGDEGGDGPYVVTDPNWQIVDNISWIKGKHSLRFGFEYSRQTFNQLGNQFSRGQFFSQPNSTALETKDATTGKVTLSGGDTLADFLLGDLYQSVVAVAVADANYVRNVQAYYVDDTYKLLPKVTVSAGLRYELTPPWNDTFGNNFNAYVPNMPKRGDTSATYPQSQWPHEVRQGSCTAANVYQGLSIRWTDTYGPAPQCSNGLLPNGPLMDTQYWNFAPRLGISYSPDSKTVIRTGYGIFYTQDIGNAYFDMARNIAGRRTVTNSDSTAPYGNSDLTWDNAAPASSGSTVTLGPTTTEYANAPSHKTSYTEQFLLNIQRQVGQDWSFEVGYQGALSRHLYGFKNANQPTPYGYIGTGAQTSVASRLPFYVGLDSKGNPAQYGIQYAHDEGTGNYNAFSVKATRRFSNGLNVIASYTLGKSLDDTSGVRNQGNDNLYPQDSECISCEYGRSAFDVKNRIVGSVLYELPIGPGKLLPVTSKGLNAAIGGWQIGGIFTHQTGAVGTPVLGIDKSSIASPFGNFDRPNPTGTSPYLKGSARTLNDWVNKAAYATPTAGYFGTLQRGSFTGPGFTNLNASLHKDFNMPYNEKHKLSIRFEAFNALNHPNWSNPNLTTSSSTFGRISSTTNSMRQLQLAAKYQF